MKQPLYKRNAFWLVLSLVLVLVSGIGASAVQSSGGSVAIKDLHWETPSGRAMSALLYTPANATAEDPAPAVVASHGWYNNREMQDLNFVELARRGYVVMSIDMYGHGNSDWLPTGEEAVRGTGMYDAVELMATLPYVDSSRIGVTGHSNGARAANFSIADDDAADTPLIAAVLLVDNDPVYKDRESGEWIDYYGSRDVGVIQAQYDEFFFRTYGEDGSILTAPRDYLTTDNAQSFLHFGAAPDDYSDAREQGEFYTENVGGDEATRVIYSLPQTHPWSHTSKAASAHLIEFFDEVFGAPTPIDSGNQVWQWKVFFNTLGLIGFGIFLVAFPIALVRGRAFSSLRQPRPTSELTATNRTGQAWFWGGLAVSAVFSAWSYIWLSQNIRNLQPEWIPQSPPYFIGLWAAVNGVFTVIVLLLFHFISGRKNGFSARANGLWPGWKKMGLTLVLGIVSTAATFALVFLVDYFFKTDFRLWVLAVKAFGPDKIWLALITLPLFLIYFVANSVSLNVFNRFTLGGREWINTAVLALFNMLGPLVLVIAQYVTFFNSGLPIDGFSTIYGIWLFPVLVILPLAAVVSRKIYRETNNPYIGGFIMAASVALVNASNTLTYAV